MTIQEMSEIKDMRGFSLSQLSQYSGVPVVTLQKIFSGKTENPRPVTLAAIERALTSREFISEGRAYQYDMARETSENRVNLLRETSKNRYNSHISGLTIDEYIEISGDAHTELIDGKIYFFAAPTVKHQQLIQKVFLAFNTYISEKGGACVVLMGPADVHLEKDDNNNMLVPDLTVTCDKDKIKDRIEGAPDFVLEVLSPSTKSRDMGIKLTKYMNAGVREYWIIDPKKERIVKYHFEDEDYLPEVFSFGEDVPVSIYDGDLKIRL